MTPPVAAGSPPRQEPTQWRWWPGPLDTQRLATDAVQACRAAAAQLARLRSSTAQITSDDALTGASFAAIDHLRVDGAPATPWAPLSGFVRARDGWVRTHANYPHHAEALRRALGATSRTELEAAALRASAYEIEERVTAAGGIAVAVRTADDWERTPHALATSDDAWVATVAGTARRPLSPTELPMAGLRVLDLTRVIAGPTCSQLLACLGADVLRVDPPSRPELLDQHLSTGMGKRSTALDLATGGPTLSRLVDGADVVLLGYRPGSLHRFGLTPDALAARRPDLVVGSLSAWGEHGDWGQRPGFDSIVQAATGIAARCGTADRPGALPVQALDHATGYRLAAGVMELLTQGRGGIVRASLLGAARELLSWPGAPEGTVSAMPVPTVVVPCGSAQVTAVPPPLLVDGRTIERPIGPYAAARPGWATDRDFLTFS